MFVTRMKASVARFATMDMRMCNIQCRHLMLPYLCYMSLDPLSLSQRGVCSSIESRPSGVILRSSSFTRVTSTRDLLAGRTPWSTGLAVSRRAGSGLASYSCTSLTLTPEPHHQYLLRIVHFFCHIPGGSVSTSERAGLHA